MKRYRILLSDGGQLRLEVNEYGVVEYAEGVGRSTIGEMVDDARDFLEGTYCARLVPETPEKESPWERAGS